MRFSRALIGATLLGLAPACAAVWGFDEGVLGSALGDSGAQDAASSGNVPADSAPVDVDADTPVPAYCSSRTADLVGGRFVDGYGGQDVDGCGSASTPCASISRVLREMSAPGVVYVGRGEYLENVVVPPALLQGGLRIEGRWQRSGDSWSTYCEAGDATSLVGVSGGDATIRVQDAFIDAGSPDEPDAADADAGPRVALTLSLLKVQSKRQAGTGESLYAVFVRDASLELVDSTLVANRGGEGAEGSDGTAGVGFGCGTGETGASGGGLPVGSFGPDGYVPSAADPKPIAERGSAGKCAKWSACQGGNGGDPGGNGGPGGASIALYLWNAAATVSGSAGLNTVGGGKGGPSGSGGDGIAGASGLCGAPGGPGGAGGAGSPGSGGVSACVVRGNGSTIQGFGADQCVALGPGGDAPPGGFIGESRAVFDAP